MVEAAVACFNPNLSRLSEGYEASRSVLVLSTSISIKSLSSQANEGLIIT